MTIARGFSGSVPFLLILPFRSLEMLTHLFKGEPSKYEAARGVFSGVTDEDQTGPTRPSSVIYVATSLNLLRHLRLSRDELKVQNTVADKRTVARVLHAFCPL